MAEQRTDLNSATVEELTQLPGIGPVLAQRIVAYRNTVHAFAEPADITTVSGIGPKSYRIIADRLTVGGSEDVSPTTPAQTPSPGEEGDTTSRALMTVETPGAEPSAELEEEVPSEDPESQMEVIPPGEAVAEQGMPLERESEEADLEDAPAGTEEAEGEAVAETEDQPVEEAGLYDVEAIPPGESFAEQGMPLEQEAREADVEDAPAETEEPEGETALKTEEEPEGEAALKTEEESVAAEDALEAEEELVEEKPVEDDLSTVSLPPRSEAPSPRSRRRLSWLWTALLGAILGMIFTLVVFAGINGSLDVGHSRAVLRIESGLDGLTADVQTLETDVEGLRRRLDTIEGLTSRMDDVESAVSGLRQETSDLSERTAALESEFVDVLEDLQQVSETVVSLQDQAERTQGFFSGLQLLMSDIFGSADGASASTPTPEGK